MLALSLNPLFENLDKALLNQIIDVMAETKVTLGQHVIEQGSRGESFFLVTEGQFDAFVRGVPKAVQKYGPEDCFGELALIYNAPRAATVTAKTPGTVFTLNRSAFQSLVQTHNTGLKMGLDQSLRTVPIFKHLTDQQRAMLVHAMDDLIFEANEYIVEAGEEADALYLILSGEVVCTRKDDDTHESKELTRLEQGQFFGESAISKSADNKVRLANVVAVTNVRVAKLTAKDFERILGNLSEVMSLNFKRTVLNSVTLFDSLTLNEKDRLAVALRETTYNIGEKVIKQGDKGTTFYIVKAGSVDVVTDGEVKATLKSGSFFGECSLLTAEPCNSTIRAAQDNLQLLGLNKSNFEVLLGPRKGILDREKSRREDISAKASIKIDDLQVIGMLGEGSFGHVQLTKHRQSGECYALKCLYKGQLIHDQQVEHAVAEKNLLASCNSPFVLLQQPTKLPPEPPYPLRRHSGPYSIYTVF